MFAHLQKGQQTTLHGKRRVWGRSVDVSALRLEDGELLIVISNNSHSHTIIMETDGALKHCLECSRLEVLI